MRGPGSAGAARAGLVLLLGAMACRGEPAAHVPVIEVARRSFARVVEADGYLRPVQTTKVVPPPEAPWAVRITWLAEDGCEVKRGDTVARLDDLEVREQLAKAAEDQAVAAASQRREQELLRFAAGDRRRAIESAERELALTRAFPKKDPEIFSRDDILGGEIDDRLKEAEVGFARRSEPVEQRMGRNKVAKWGVDQRKAGEAMARANKGLRALSVTATHDGVFTLRRNNAGEPIRVGDLAFPGTYIGDVAVLQTMEVEAFVLEVEADGLSEGKAAQVVIQSQSGKIYPAHVKQVESVPRRRQQQSPTQYFGVILTLDPPSLPPGGAPGDPSGAAVPPQQLKPGQRVRARLSLNQQQERLVVPRAALFEQDGKKVVYRREPGGAFVAVQVVLGPATAGLLTIESGLRPGDVVALRDPGKAAADLVPGLSSPAPAPGLGNPGGGAARPR